MATMIKRQVAGTTRIVLRFDQAPTLTELRQAIGSVDQADRGLRFKGVDTTPPLKFVFVQDAETETDVPVV